MKFNVLLSGTPPLTIKWFKDKKEVLSTVNCSVHKDDSSSSLELFFTKPSDSGDYICEIANDVGSVSCQATLFVKGFYSVCSLFLMLDGRLSSCIIRVLKITHFSLFCYAEPPKFTRKPDKISVVKHGQSVVFECQVIGTPEIDTYWFRDGNEISSDAKHKVSFTNSLTRLEITGTDTKDSGVYYCEARNDAGSESCSMELKVKGQ